MTISAKASLPPSSLLAFFREELAPRPGRVAACLRIAFCCSFVVFVSMLYQVPLPTYSAYLVFMVSKEEIASTLLIGVVGVIAVTLAVAFSLLLYMIDASEPALRLPLMAGGAFLGMFLSRTLVIGSAVFLVGFVLVLTQTLIDDFPNLEILTRLLLWIWVVVSLPVFVTVLLNLLIGENPAQLARAAALRLLDTIAAFLRGGKKPPLEPQQDEVLDLFELRQRAAKFDPNLRAGAITDALLIETLGELVMMQRALPADTTPEARLPLAEACVACSDALREDEPASDLTPHRVDTDVLLNLRPDQRPVIIAMSNIIERLYNSIVRRKTATAVPLQKKSKNLFVADAFSNPDHVRFALKTTVAVMAAYIIYTGIDWPGIRTSITTCFFVALGSLGETMHKLTLRLAGALIGGVAAGLCIILVLPQMTDIGQLCLLIAAVSTVCAWVATSSERLAYAGMQMAFAFFLGVLHDYAPATNLSDLRDRVVGILLGNILMSLVFSVLWPVSALEQARSALAAALRALGQILGGNGHQAGTDERLAVVRSIDKARRFVWVAVFEATIFAAAVSSKKREEISLDALDRLAAATYVILDQSADEELGQELHAQKFQAYDAAMSAWFLAYATRVAADQPVPPVPDFSDLAHELTVLPEQASVALRSEFEARILLQSEVERAGSHAA